MPHDIPRTQKTAGAAMNHASIDQTAGQAHARAPRTRRPHAAIRLARHNAPAWQRLLRLIVMSTVSAMPPYASHAMADEVLALPAQDAPPTNRLNRDLVREARAAMHRAGEYFATRVAVNGGYVYTWSPDLTVRRGEGLAKPTEIWVQPPGTPTVGLALLHGWQATGDLMLRDAAVAAAQAIVFGQLESGGWTRSIDFNPAGRDSGRYRNGKGNPRGRNTSSFDDDQSQAALRLLMEVDQALKFRDPQIHEAAEFALDAILNAQFPAGGFPQVWEGPVPAQPPKKGSFPDYDWRTEGRIKDYWNHYTLNDGLAGSVSRTLVEAHRIYGDERCLTALKRLGDFLILAQLPEPQPGWAQQYNPQMQPMWARKFEPPAVAGQESEDAVSTLLLICRHTNDRRYLEPIPSALAWLKRSRLPDGRLARFYELMSNRPLYMTRNGDQYSLTWDDSRLPDHYGFKTASRLEELEQEYRSVQDGIPLELREPFESLRADAERIIRELDEDGRWMSTWRGERLVGQPKLRSGELYLSSDVFSRNMQRLAEFVQTSELHAE